MSAYLEESPCKYEIDIESESESDLLHDMTKELVFKSWDVCAHIIN